MFTDATKFNKCNAKRIFIDDPYLTSDITIGMQLNIDQDEIILECIAKDETTMQCKVVKGGMLKDMAYVCMRGATRGHPVITVKDYSLLQFSMEYQVRT